jgi:hypothetical protein
MNIHAGLIQSSIGIFIFLFYPQIATLLDLCILLDKLLFRLSRAMKGKLFFNDQLLMPLDFYWFFIWSCGRKLQV